MMSGLPLFWLQALAGHRCLETRVLDVSPPSLHSLYAFIVFQRKYHHSKFVLCKLEIQSHSRAFQDQEGNACLRSRRQDKFHWERFPSSLGWSFLIMMSDVYVLDEGIRVVDLISESKRSVNMRFCHFWLNACITRDYDVSFNLFPWISSWDSSNFRLYLV